MAELRVPQIDFSALGDLPKVYKDARREATREQTLASLGQGPLDYNAAAQKLLAVGDTQGAMTLASLGNNQRDFQFREQEAARAQGNADRGFGLQQQQANRPTVQRDENGNLITINPQGTSAAVLPVSGGASGPANPFAPAGKQTEGEANASLYARRMFNSERILRDNEASGTDLAQRAKAGFPVIGNYLVNEPYQKFDQARRDFINATLRRESGAVISAPEFDNAERQYFPRPGDSKDTIDQKRKNRQEAMSGIAGAAGKNFKPEYTFGPKGEIVDRAAQTAAGAARPQAGAPVKVSSPQERDALQPGTQYIAPDGSVRTKQ